MAISRPRLFRALPILAIALASPVTANAVDLWVWVQSAPTAVAARQAYSVNVTVGYGGSGSWSSGSPWAARVRICASRDPVFDWSDIVLGEALTYVQGNPATISMGVQFPETIPLGNYYYLAVVDPYNQVPETNEVNNTAVGPVATVTYVDPDLTVANVSGPSAVTAGKTATVSYTVSSSSSSSSSAEVGALVRVYLSADAILDAGDVLLGQGGAMLKPGQSLHPLMTVTIPAGVTGPFYYLAVVDPLNTVRESNEGNNLSLGNATTVTYVDPDLTIANVTGPAAATSGWNVTVSYTVSSSAAASLNAGVNALVRVYLSADSIVDAGDVFLGEGTITLKPGQDVASSLTGTIPARVTGQLKYLAVVDPLGAVRESNEGNNLAVGNSVAVTCNPSVPIPPGPNPCMVATCDPVLGIVEAPKPQGSSCSDGNSCNGAETCSATGTCVAGTPQIVDDGNPCTQDLCYDVPGIFHLPIPGCGAKPIPSDYSTMAFSWDQTGNLTSVDNISSDASNCGTVKNVCPASPQTRSALAAVEHRRRRGAGLRAAGRRPASGGCRGTVRAVCAQ